MKILLLALTLFISSCSAMGDLAIGVSSHVIGDLVTDEIKKDLKEKEDGKKPTQ